MSDQDEPKPPQSQGEMTLDSEHRSEQQAAHHPTQAERDEEIAAIQQHARKQHPGIECPPNRPPVPPGKAVLIGVVALLVLLAAGGLTLVERLTHSRVLARETEQSAVPTVAVVHPLAEKPDVVLVLRSRTPSTPRSRAKRRAYSRTVSRMASGTPSAGITA